MNPDFWLQRWKEGSTAFHSDEVHPDLISHGDWFLGGGPHRVLVPLSGKSVDLAWMADQGHEVVGVELSEEAVRTQLASAGRQPEVTREGAHQVFRTPGLTVYQGDFFALPATLGRGPGGAGITGFDRVWDRAAMVALPPTMRVDYVRHLRALAGGATILLDACEYDPTVMDGPPFSVPEPEIREHYRTHRVERVETRDDLAPRFAERGHRWWRSSVYRITP